MPSNVLTAYASITDVFKVLLPQGVPELVTVGSVYRVGTSLPSGLDVTLPYVRVDRVGGRQEKLLETPVLDLDVFHSSRPLAVSLSETISTFLLGYPHAVVLPGGRKVILDIIEQVSPPVEVPWDDSNIRRFLSSYQITVRR